MINIKDSNNKNFTIHDLWKVKKCNMESLLQAIHVAEETKEITYEKILMGGVVDVNGEGIRIIGSNDFYKIPQKGNTILEDFGIQKDGIFVVETKMNYEFKTAIEAYGWCKSIVKILDDGTDMVQRFQKSSEILTLVKPNGDELAKFIIVGKSGNKEVKSFNIKSYAFTPEDLAKIARTAMLTSNKISKKYSEENILFSHPADVLTEKWDLIVPFHSTSMVKRLKMFFESFGNNDLIRVGKDLGSEIISYHESGDIKLTVIDDQFDINGNQSGDGHLFMSKAVAKKLGIPQNISLIRGIVRLGKIRAFVKGRLVITDDIKFKGAEGADFACTRSAIKFGGEQINNASEFGFRLYVTKDEDYSDKEAYKLSYLVNVLGNHSIDYLVDFNRNFRKTFSQKVAEHNSYFESNKIESIMGSGMDSIIDFSKLGWVDSDNANFRKSMKENMKKFSSFEGSSAWIPALAMKDIVLNGVEITLEDGEIALSPSAYDRMIKFGTPIEIDGRKAIVAIGDRSPVVSPESYQNLVVFSDSVKIIKDIPGHLIVMTPASARGMGLDGDDFIKLSKGTVRHSHNDRFGFCKEVEKLKEEVTPLGATFFGAWHQRNTGLVVHALYGYVGYFRQLGLSVEEIFEKEEVKLLVQTVQTLVQGIKKGVKLPMSLPSLLELVKLDKEDGYADGATIFNKYVEEISLFSTNVLGQSELTEEITQIDPSISGLPGLSPEVLKLSHRAAVLNMVETYNLGDVFSIDDDNFKEFAKAYAAYAYGVSTGDQAVYRLQPVCSNLVAYGILCSNGSLPKEDKPVQKPVQKPVASKPVAPVKKEVVTTDPTPGSVVKDELDEVYLVLNDRRFLSKYGEVLTFPEITRFRVIKTYSPKRFNGYDYVSTKLGVRSLKTGIVVSHPKILSMFA